jgi:hypothetical protein|uniref:YABBY protein C-terminal domain-containing protein n=1 Tax=viral metagenome TaxID=1070528 RepID=A0A6C0LY75_9ZZZZ
MSSSKNVSGKKIMECLRLALDEENEYAIDDIKKLAVNAFKEASKIGVGKKRIVKVDSDGVVIKKLPSKYNLFIKDEMARMTIEFPDTERKELMKLAAKNWNDTKSVLQETIT